ncbi:hypothetical protein PHYSODRAFT_473385, partial [Phytophthora sojae]
LLPSTSQLKNRAHKLRKRGDFSITTYADAMEWASPRMCTTKEQFFQHMSYLVESDDVRILQEPFGYQHELLVLDCFTDRLDDGELSLGIIFTSRRLFRTLPRVILGQRSQVLGAPDGTYKLHFGGWTLVSFGTFGVRYTASHKYQHKFYPMAFMFVRTETAFAYARLFTVCRERGESFFGGTLTLQHGSMDHSTSIANAFRQEWPDIKLLNCWPHLHLKARGKKAHQQTASQVTVNFSLSVRIVIQKLVYICVFMTKTKCAYLSKLVAFSPFGCVAGETASATPATSLSLNPTASSNPRCLRESCAAAARASETSSRLGIDIIFQYVVC